jgi:hypothetical protein
MISLGKVVIFSASVVAGFAGSALPAVARPPATATGTYTPTLVSLDTIRTPDGAQFNRAVEKDAYTGGLVGTATATYTIRVFKKGSFTGQGREVCDPCTIGGRTGGFIAVFNFRSTADGGFTGHETFLSASGGLAGLHGGGTFDSGEGTDPYSYSYHFEP